MSTHPKTALDDRMEDVEGRLDRVEGVLSGTMDTPGLVHIQQQIAKTVFGKDGNNGLLQDVQDLKMDRVRALAWIAGGTAAGSAVSGLLIWVFTHAPHLLKP